MLNENMDTITNSDNNSKQYKGKKELRKFVQKRITKGSKPSKELEEFIRKLIEEAVELNQMIVISKPETEITGECRTKISPYFAFQSIKYTKIDAAKWKTKKEKFKGTYLLSPIDVETKKVMKCKYYQRLIITGLLDTEKYTTIINNEMLVEGTLQGAASICCGPLFGKYSFDTFHFHFGDSENNGTEHSINGQRYALEMHLVFSPTRGDLPPKVKNNRSVNAVLTLIFEESSVPSYYELFSLIPYIKENNKSMCVSNNLLYDFKDVLNSSDYYNYVGCSCAIKETRPNVEWIIFKQMLPIQKSQMDLLRQLKASGNINSITSLIKPIGERLVFEPSYRSHLKCRQKSSCEC